MRLTERALRFRLYLLLRGRLYQHYHKRIRKMVSSNLLTMSSDNLTRLLTFVAGHNRYYARLLSQRSNLESIPVLKKETIQQNFEDMLSIPQGPGSFRNSSGGSTGRPVTLAQDENYVSWNNATQGYYFREFLGVDMNAVKNVWLWGSERDSLRMRSRRMRTWAGRLLRSQLFLNTFDTDERRWFECIERIRNYRPHFVAGYAGSLYQISRVARRHNIRLYRPEFVYSSAEMLRPFMRQEIEEQFNTKVFDYYGSREVGAIAGECAKGNRHVFVMNNIVEALDDDDHTVADGEEGRLVVTNLHNYSLPMIRYEIGDTGALSAEGCTCGSTLPVLKQLTGRVTDHFILKNGTLVHGEFITHLFYFREWVEQFQVDQVDYDRLRIRVVRRDAVDESDIRDIERSINFVMGENCKMEWEYVDSIDKSQQGKHLFTRRLLGDESIGPR